MEQLRKLIPDNIDFQSITTISQEAREKLTAVRPKNFGQAADLPGVSKADLTALLVWLKLHNSQSKKQIKSKSRLKPNTQEIQMKTGDDF